jgi:hypothetical protein
MTPPRFVSCATLLTLAILAAGCGKPAAVPVTGTVTWDGKEMPDGKILFEDEDAKIPPASGDVKAGKYELRVQPGKKKVRITASREVPGAKVDPAMGGVPRQSYVPARYNSDTTLSADVKVGAENKFDFPLKP